VPLFGCFYVTCLSSFWRSGLFWCELVERTQWSGHTAFLFTDELGEDFFNRLINSATAYREMDKLIVNRIVLQLCYLQSAPSLEEPALRVSQYLEQCYPLAHQRHLMMRPRLCKIFCILNPVS
jgi:hypothetical protein